MPNSPCSILSAVICKITNVAMCSFAGQALVYDPNRAAAVTANATDASQPDPSGGEVDQGRRRVLQSNIVTSPMFSLAHIVATRVRESSEYEMSLRLDDSTEVLNMLRHARLNSASDGDASTDDCAEQGACADISVVDAAALAVEISNTYAGVLLLNETATNLDLLSVANAMRLVVDSSAQELVTLQLSSRKEEMLPEELLLDTDNFRAEFSLERVTERVIRSLAEVVPLGRVQAPEPEPEPEPEPTAMLEGARRYAANDIRRYMPMYRGPDPDPESMPTVPRGIQQGSLYRDGEASTLTSDDDDDDNDEFDLDEGDEPDAATIDRSGNAAANRLEAVIASIARREGNTRETRERAQRIRRDILVARRIRGGHGHVPALQHAWEGLSVD